jgi:thiamine biosynthesis lipoprotein
VSRRDYVGALGAGMVGGLLPRLPRLPLHPPDDRFVERWSWAMGQPVHAIVFASSETEGLDACAAALAELRRVESRLTLFDDASDLCELNRHAGCAAMRIDDDLQAVLRAAEGFRRTTGGAFNVAVEPLMRAWGFHERRVAQPGAAEITAAREAVTAAAIELDGDRARLSGAHTRLDFGGIGVGYGIDRALAEFTRRGIRRAFLDVSGDCAATGAPPGTVGWPVAIVDPGRPGGVTGTVSLRNAALATSANTVSVMRYGRWIIGHVMSPATGWPAHALVQASVVARNATAADALSTAMLVTGRTAPGVLRAFAV